MSKESSTPEPVLVDDQEIDRLSELLNLYLDEALDESQEEELIRILADQAEARTRMRDMTRLHAELHALYSNKGMTEPLGVQG